VDTNINNNQLDTSLNKPNTESMGPRMAEKPVVLGGLDSNKEPNVESKGPIGPRMVEKPVVLGGLDSNKEPNEEPKSPIGPRMAERPVVPGGIDSNKEPNEEPKSPIDPRMVEKPVVLGGLDSNKEPNVESKSPIGPRMVEKPVVLGGLDLTKEPNVESKGPIGPRMAEKPVVLGGLDSNKEPKDQTSEMNVNVPSAQINVPNQKNIFEVKIDENILNGSLLDTKIDKINNQENVYECGRVIKVTNFIVEVAGLDNLSFFEKVKIGDSALGYVNGILENSVTVAILKNSKMIKVDDKVYSTGETLNTFFSNQFVGRIIDMFGNDLYTENKFENMTKINIETKPIPIMARGTVNRPLQTGVSGIDLIYPIGKGQRQLIVGDKKTGKTQLCLDVIANQQNKQVLCIYVAIGKTKKEVKSIYNELQTRGALSYTMIISAFNDDKPPIIYLTPYAALSIAEVFMKSKYDVLVVIDDLKRHADAYREISLVSGKTPGRDAYPADIFYTHSRMLEKGCQLENGGSITILPIVETKGEDITDYITTNIISITDGQIYLSSKLFNKGQKPAIDYGLSVSRLGGAVQEPDMKKLGASVRLKLLNYLETQDVYQFANLDEMGGNLKNKIIEGKKLMELLNQNKFSPKTKEEIINDFKSALGATNES